MKGRCPGTLPYLRSYSSRLFFISSLSLSLSFALSLSSFCFLLTSAHGRQMEAGRRRRTSRFPGSPALSLLLQYQVGRVPLRTFVLTFLACFLLLLLHFISLSLSLFVTFLFHVIRCKWKANRLREEKQCQFPSSPALWPHNTKWNYRSRMRDSLSLS